MSEGSERDEVDTCLGIRNHRVEGNATRRLRLNMHGGSMDKLNGTVRVLRSEVVEHYAVGLLLDGFLQLFEVAHLALYLQVKSLVLKILLGTSDGVVYAATEVDVVVFQQYHVEKPYTVVHASANAHGFLFKHSHARRSLTGVEHTGIGACVYQRLLVAVGHGGDAAHALQEVEHEPLGLQQTLLLSADAHHYIAGAHMGSVVHQHRHLQRGVEAMEDFLRHALAGKDAFFLNHKVTLAHCVGRDAAKGGMVAVLYVLGKGEVDETVGKFFLFFLVSHGVLIFEDAAMQHRT